MLILLGNLPPLVDETAVHKLFDYAKFIESVLLIDVGHPANVVAVVKIQSSQTVANVIAAKVNHRRLEGRKVQAFTSLFFN